MRQLLEGQVAVVTGGSVGIGKAIAHQFVEAGVKVALIGTNQDVGQATAKELTALHPTAEAVFYQADVSLTDQVDRTMQKILEQSGKIDILVNNAGVTADQLLMKMKEEEWDRVLAVNLKSCYNTCRAVVRPMMKAKKGKIINISSIVGLTGNIGQVNYAASKAGMIGLTKALAKELASRQICVNCVAPGFIRTRMTDMLSEKQKEDILRNIPLGRIGEPLDVAWAVWFLASPLSNYITGQVLPIDGGYGNNLG